MHAKSLLPAAALLFLGAGQTATPPASTGPVIPVPTPVISSKIPVSITFPNNPNLTDTDVRPLFDAFSWQSFIALNWPAVPGQRGVAKNPNDPKTFTGAPNGTLTVWRTYKQSWELFGQGNNPTPWTSFENADNPCDDKSTDSTNVVPRTAKGGSVLDEVNQATSYPLIDQRLNYVQYEVRYNEAQYNFIFNSKFYLQANIGKSLPIQMPSSSAQPYMVGSMMLKAGWRILTANEDPSRYYTVKTRVLDPVSGQCTPQTVGLIGFHIAQKADGFPEWIWSTFEQIDNVPDALLKKPAAGWTLNNGTNNPPTSGGWANRPNYKSPNLVPKSQRTATQITRFNPIPITPTGASTRDVNDAFRKALAGTPWAYYQLVFTQWPTNPAQFTPFGYTKPGGGATGVYPADSGQPFPINNVTNSAIESYLQSGQDAFGAGGNSCMQCHYSASPTDYSWGLFRRPHP